MPTISLSELEQYLWAAANILRGPVEHSDFKTYIFPLLFFKRISDVYDEEFQQALDDSGEDIEYAHYTENYRFQIPEDCHWKDVREKTVNVGQALSYALRGIEKANPDTLYGIFGDAQWTNKDRFSDGLILKLIEHFSTINLSNSNVEPDMAGQAYEYLIKKFADISKKKAGEFYTPRSVVRLMTLILDPNEKESIYDPACGTGGMLLEAVNHVKNKGRDTRTLKLYGQEKNLTTSAVSRMNMILHDLEDFTIIRGDTLTGPSFFDGDNLAKFDCVIANPPFSLKNWGYESWISDPYGRNFAGQPPKNNGDYAWVQHMISSMVKPDGRMAVVLSQGTLSRSGKEGKIRKKIIEIDLLEAVIGLGLNLFYGTGLAACVLIFRSMKSIDKKKRVLFIDASKLYKKGRSQNTLLDNHVDQIFSIYNEFKDVEGIAKIVALEEIKENDYNLSISRYVEPVIKEESIPLDEALSDLKIAVESYFTGEEKITDLLIKEGIIQ
jgi:type I restriction enzyme M protein